MQCPKCGGRSRVYATKPHGTQKQRYRQCTMCGHRFSTWEEAEARDLRPFKRRVTEPDLFGNTGEKEASK